MFNGNEESVALGHCVTMTLLIVIARSSVKKFNCFTLRKKLQLALLLCEVDMDFLRESNGGMGVQ